MGDLKVRELIDWSTRQWDRGKIAATFTPRTCAEILATPLSQLDSQDSRYGLQIRPIISL